MNLYLERDRDIYFKPIQVGGGISVSIQASQYHYCSPRLTLPNADLYQHFEVALLLNGYWLHPATHPKLKTLSWTQYWHDDADIANEIPRSVVMQMLQDLSVKFGN